jgi:uncharacterized phage infection (PIP) family protein YhgE
MNKITEILPTDPGKQAAGKSKAVEQQDGPSFHEVLQKITSDGQGQGQQSTETASAVSGASQAAEAASGAGIDPVMSPKQVTGLMRAERTLELLSEYENQLGDGEVSLKDMAGTVDALETEAKELNKILETLDPDDSLFGLLQDVATVAVVESIKFNRGDYLPAATACRIHGRSGCGRNAVCWRAREAYPHRAAWRPGPGCATHDGCSPA